MRDKAGGPGFSRVRATFMITPGFLGNRPAPRRCVKTRDTARQAKPALPPPAGGRNIIAASGKMKFHAFGVHAYLQGHAEKIGRSGQTGKLN